MRLRQQIVAVVASLVLLMTQVFIEHVASSQTATSSVTVLPGRPLTAVLTNASMRETAGGIAGSIVVRVQDERGYASGWTLSLATQDFTGPSGHLGAGLLAISPDTLGVALGNPTLSGLAISDIAPMRLQPAALLSAAHAFGDGHYEMVVDAALGLPDDQRSGYLYTVIVNIDGSAP